MKIGFVGSGKMGSQMILRLLENGEEVSIYARHPKKAEELKKNGGQIFSNYPEFVNSLGEKKIIFLMVPHGKATDSVIESLSPLVKKGDIIVDGGNSYYKESIRRGKELGEKGIEFMDMGTSGGLEGARNGASIMVGGKKEIFDKIEPVLKILSAPNGYGYMGKSGAGHFVKMVHNGIEYSLLQSYGEGFELLEKSEFNLDLKEVTKVYQNGSVIRSWLIDLLAGALEKDPKLDSFKGIIGGGSTGEWTLKTAEEMGAKMPLLEKAMDAREKSFRKQSFATKVVSALRNQFGGHEEPE